MSSNFRGLEDFFIFSSAISACCSFLVIVTALSFPSMLKRHFMQIVFCISLSDFIASLASSLGFPDNGSMQCQVQAFLILMFYRATFLWTTVLCYQLHCIVLYGKVGLSNLSLHSICWLIPLGLTVLPLMHLDYGRPDIFATGGGSLGWCYLNNKNEIAYIFWAEYVWWGGLFICEIVMLYCIVRVLWEQQRRVEIFSKRVLDIVNILYLYPLILAVTWIPYGLYSSFFRALPETEAVVDTKQVLSAYSFQNGTLLAIVFFTKSEESRSRWRALCCSKNNNDESKSEAGDFEGHESMLDEVDGGWLDIFTIGFYLRRENRSARTASSRASTTLNAPILEHSDASVDSSIHTTPF